MKTKILFAISVSIFVSPLFTSALTLTDLELQLRFISSQLKNVQSQSGAAASAVGSFANKPDCPVLIHTLVNGNTDATTGGEVSMLQNFLVLKGEIPVNTFSEVPKGIFGHLTQIALESWQTQHNLLATGETDAVTRTSIVTCSGADIPKPVIAFRSNKEHISAGEEVIRTWTAQHATRCSMQETPDSGTSTETTVELNGTLSQRPDISTTVRLTCENDIGSETNGPESSASVRVVVDQSLSAVQVNGLMQASAALAALESLLKAYLAH